MCAIKQAWVKVPTKLAHIDILLTTIWQQLPCSVSKIFKGVF